MQVACRTWARCRSLTPGSWPPAWYRWPQGSVLRVSIATIRSGPPPGTRSRQVPYPPGGPSRLAGVKENPAPPGGGPGPARFPRLFGPGRAQPCPTAWPCWSVTVTHHVVSGFRAAAAARSRASHGSTGPSPRQLAGPVREPGRGAHRHGQRDPPGEPAPGAAGRARAGRPVRPAGRAIAVLPGGVRGPGAAGAGVLAQDQVQEGAGAQLVHPAVQPGRLELAGPPADPLIRGQHLIGRQLPPHQRRVARVLGPPLHPGEPRRGLPPLPRRARGDLDHRPGDGRAQPARGQPPGPVQHLGLGRPGFRGLQDRGGPDDDLGLGPADGPAGQRVQRAGQPGAQVPRRGQQRVGLVPGLAQRQGQLIPGELVHHARHLPRPRLEPVLGVTPEHLRDRDQLAGRRVRLDPVPRARQPDQLLIGHPAERVTRPAAGHRGVGGHRQLRAARHHVPRHPGAEPGRPAIRLAREHPARAGLARTPPPRAGRLQGEHLIGGGLAGLRQLLAGQLVLPRRRRARFGIPVLLRAASDGSSSCPHSQSSHARCFWGLTGSRSGQAGSPPRPGSPGAGTEGMNHVRSAKGLFSEHNSVNSPGSPALPVHFE